MYPKILLAAALAAAFAMPAVAATSAKTSMKPAAKVYYAEQSVKSKMCYAVTFKPDGKHATMIGTASFPTLKATMAAIKADADCKAPKMAKTKAKTNATAKAKAKTTY
jgi:hypothetical protein